jgi:gamma-glutamylcyclotransferase (GGCT)/AIG2-like uncharacterized protein YtfP
MSETVLLAVYGTLKRGCGNHALIANAQYIGSDKLQEISLYDIGPYPGARLEASAGIEIEVYAVTPSQLARLDLLEEYDPADPSGSLYTRESLETRFGSTWVYLYQGDVAGKPCLRSGAWVSPAEQSLSQESEEEA